MKHRLTFILYAIAAFSLSSCVERVCQPPPGFEFTSQARLRAVNVSPDARNVDIFLDGNSFIPNLAYAYLEGYKTNCSISDAALCYRYIPDAATHTIEVRAGGVTLKTWTGVLNQRAKYTFIIYDYASQLKVKLLPDNGDSKVDNNTSRLRFFNGGPDAGNINLRLHSKTNPNEFPDPGLAFGEVLDYKDFTAGVKGFYLINQTTDDEIIGIDSTYLVSPLMSKAFFTVINVGLRKPFGDAPIGTALILNDSGNATANCLGGAVLAYLPIAGVRMINAASRTYDSLDLIVNGRDNFPHHPNVLGVHYGEASRDYLPFNLILNSILKTIEIRPSKPSSLAFTTETISNFSLSCNSLSTILAVGTKPFGSADQHVALVPLVDTVSVTTTPNAVNARFYNASVDADTVDEVFIDTTPQSQWATTPFMKERGVIEIGTGSHTLYAVSKNGTSPTITYPNFTAGKTYTILALPKTNSTDPFTITVVEH